MTSLSLIKFVYINVLHGISVYATVLGLSGQAGRSLVNNASMVLGLRSFVGYECDTQIDRGRPR